MCFIMRHFLQHYEKAIAKCQIAEAHLAWTLFAVQREGLLEHRPHPVVL